MKIFRNKKRDRECLDNLSDALRKFKKLKAEKWERIDEEVQASNLPGTPTEDWIIPPDESITLKLLLQDGVYKKLREEIEVEKEKVFQIAKFFKIPSHSIEWLSFGNPLIGNAAIDEALDSLHLLKETQKKAFYFLENIKSLFQSSSS